MGKTFLTKEQKATLEKSGWEIIPSTDGVIWFGQDWDSRKNSLVSISGYDFLVIGIRPERGE